MGDTCGLGGYASHNCEGAHNLPFSEANVLPPGLRVTIAAESPLIGSDQVDAMVLNSGGQGGGKQRATLTEQNLEALKRWRNEYDEQRQKAKYSESIV